MSNREFTAQRTMLANAFATAGAELMEYMGVPSALAAIPNTEPPQYVVAGTLQMIAKVLPAASAVLQPTGDLTDEQISSFYKQTCPGMPDAQSNAPTNKMVFDFARAIERAAIAAYLARQAQAEPVAWIKVEDNLPAKYCLAVYETPRGKQRIIRAMYVAKFTVEAQGDDCYSEINDENDTEYLREGWYELIDNWGEYSSVHVCEGVVTHWMPLPEAPSLQTGSANTQDGGEA